MTKEEAIGRVIGTFIALGVMYIFFRLFDAPAWAIYGFLVLAAYAIDIKFKLED